jgi:hypothetical protein
MAYPNRWPLHAPRCGRGRPRSQGGKPSQSHGWRCARPRARSPQGDGGPCLLPDFAQSAPDAGGDARAPRGKMPSWGSALPGGHPANPTAGDALVPERGARRATGGQAYHQLPRDGPKDAGGDARGPRGKMPSWGSALPKGNPANPTPGETPGLGRGARRATGDQAYHQLPRDGPQDAGEDARAPRERPAHSQRAPDAGEDARAPRGGPAGLAQDRRSR